MRQVCKTVYTIGDHPDPALCAEYIRDNWHDLHHSVSEEAVDSIKGFCKAFNLAGLEYSIAPFGDRGEFINAELPEDLQELSGVRVYKWLVNNGLDKILSGDCPFTGVCYDEDLLDPIRAFMAAPCGTFQALIDDCLHNAIVCYHKECEWLYGDEHITEMAQANEYEFLETGEFYG